MKTKSAAKPTTDRQQKEVERDLAATYNKFKEFEGKQYTGMKVGGHHKWYYDAGEWKETKVAPDRWEVFSHGGRKTTGLEAVAWAQKAVSLGAGEIVLNSIDADGTKAGCSSIWVSIRTLAIGRAAPR